MPKGKLNPGERALAAAKREVLEETGYKVSVHEFLGSMSYAFDGKIKIVQFWHMRTVGEPTGKLTNDVKAVKWLSLKRAIETLSRSHEKVFLANVGPAALKAVKQSRRDKPWPRGGERLRNRAVTICAGLGTEPQPVRRRLRLDQAAIACGATPNGLIGGCSSADR